MIEDDKVIDERIIQIITTSNAIEFIKDMDVIFRYYCGCEDHIAIIVKKCYMQNMFSILTENNCEITDVSPPKSEENIDEFFKSEKAQMYMIGDIERRKSIDKKLCDDYQNSIKLPEEIENFIKLSVEYSEYANFKPAYKFKDGDDEVDKKIKHGIDLKDKLLEKFKNVNQNDKILSMLRELKSTNDIVIRDRAFEEATRCCF